MLNPPTLLLIWLPRGQTLHKCFPKIFFLPSLLFTSLYFLSPLTIPFITSHPDLPSQVVFSCFCASSLIWFCASLNWICASSLVFFAMVYIGPKSLLSWFYLPSWNLCHVNFFCLWLFSFFIFGWVGRRYSRHVMWELQNAVDWYLKRECLVIIIFRCLFFPPIYMISLLLHGDFSTASLVVPSLYN